MIQKRPAMRVLLAFLMLNISLKLVYRQSNTDTGFRPKN
jgi:hypothetical protein